MGLQPPECQHPNRMQGQPNVGISFCPDCGAYIDQKGSVLFFTEEAEAEK